MMKQFIFRYRTVWTPGAMNLYHPRFAEGNAPLEAVPEPYNRNGEISGRANNADNRSNNTAMMLRNTILFHGRFTNLTLGIV